MELLVAELLAQARRIWKYRWLGLAAAWVLAQSQAQPNAEAH